MTNTKFRKRALISSVAMLLVAIVALGSATFAWFNTQNSATAQTITAQTTKGSDITLSETGGNAPSPWTHNLNFMDDNTNHKYTLGDNTALVPVTTKNFSNWYTVNAADYDSGFATDTPSPVQITNEAHIKHSYLYVKSTKAQNVTITPVVTTTNEDDAKFIRMAFVPIATSTTISGHKATTEQKVTKTTIWYDTALNDRSKSSWNAANQAAESQWDSSNAVLNDSMTDPIVLENVTADAINGFEVWVWAEGTDFDCHDENAGTNVTITFNVKGSLNSGS